KIFFFQAEDGIRDFHVTGVQTCALPILKKKVEDEFREELPFEDLDGKGLLDAKAPRRDFLKYLGFSTAAATLAASCKTPVRKARSEERRVGKERRDTERPRCTTSNESVK